MPTPSTNGCEPTMISASRLMAALRRSTLRASGQVLHFCQAFAEQSRRVLRWMQSSQSPPRSPRNNSVSTRWTATPQFLSMSGTCLAYLMSPDPCIAREDQHQDAVEQGPSTSPALRQRAGSSGEPLGASPPFEWRGQLLRCPSASRPTQPWAYPARAGRKSWSPRRSLQAP